VRSHLTPNDEQCGAQADTLPRHDADRVLVRPPREPQLAGFTDRNPAGIARNIPDQGFPLEVRQVVRGYDYQTNF
jgi:hypothetical protein